MNSDELPHSAQTVPSRKRFIRILILVFAAACFALSGWLLFFCPQPTYTNDTYGFTLTLPRSWAGHYRMVDYGTAAEFYQAGAADGSGRLMTVMVTNEDWETVEKGSPVPVSKLDEGNGVLVYIRWPSDVQNISDSMLYGIMQSAAKNLGSDDISFFDVAATSTSEAAT